MKATILLFLISYIVGSLNFAIILFRLLGKPDPRTRHSGNAGATNVYRQAGFLWAVVVFGLAILRTLGMIWVGLQWLSPTGVIWIGLALLVGNRFPCFHGFKGGKGVADYCGITLLLAPVAVPIGAVGWLFTKGFTRQPFMASLVLTPILGIGTLVHYSRDLLSVLGVLLTVALVVYNHRPNILSWWQDQITPINK